jgi:hypothetical protein
MAKVCLCGCGYPVFSNKYAKYCQNKRTDDKWLSKQGKSGIKKRISPISEKKAEQLAIYRVKRDKYLSENTVCEVKDCNKPSSHIHHMNGRNGSMIYNEEYFMAVGICCHPKRIHENPAWARAMGYLI